MDILLFSNDSNLAGFCREVVVEVFGAESKLAVGSPAQLPGDEDLCLWDFTPGETSIPQLDTRTLRRHLFLLHRKHLPALHELLGTSNVNVLLKPVTAATLRAFLGDSHWQRSLVPHNGESIDRLRGERDEMLQFLIQANLKLQEYDHERTNFLARSLHDVRAPLTAISGYCGLLLDEELGPLTQEQREVLGRMQHSSTRLSRIANSMFQLSTRLHGDEEMNFENADIQDCVDQALHEVALFLEDKRITVTVNIEPPQDGLFFARSQMEQALVNLLDNACKFTPRNGAIEIRGYPFFWERRTCRGELPPFSQDRRLKQVTTPNSFRIDICDSGPGIPAAHLGTIFEEYTSYSGGDDRSGGGLGLAICRMILQQHGGRIWAESRTAGAIFSFVLPVRAVGPPACATQESPVDVCAAALEESRS